MPVKNLEMHEIVMCLPEPDTAEKRERRAFLDEKLARNFAESGGY